jgi:mediator of replication checkpoint protein 1
MASSRESSPANDSSPTSPLQLTPNSKVKALLASLDNDSDEETVSGSAIATLNSTFAQKPTANTPSLLLDSGIASERTLAQDPKKDPLADDEDEDEDIFRPKGRLAARMQATEDSSESEVEIRLDDARERVKKMLMNPESTISGQDAEDNDKSDTSVVPLKRKVRVRRRSTPTSSPEEGSASPNLFVSPTKSAGTASNASDSEEFPSNPLENARFKALVEKKRQERLEKEAQAAEQKAKRMTELKRQRTLVEQNDMNDDFVEQRLTQQTKPTRKASKKAQEEIAREVQRMSRNMQLAHEARTRKKITKADLFKRFNYKPVGMKEENTDGPTSSSPAPHSDIEKHETPPTSPASHGGDVEKPSVVSKSLAALNDLPKLENRLQAEVEEDLPPLEIALTSSPPQKLDKGKGKATGILSPDPKLENIPVFKQRPVRIRPPVTADRKESTLADSDSDLEILTAKTPDARMKKLDAIFDRVPANQSKESRPLQALKILAHLTSPGKQTLGRNQKPSMTTTQLHLSLQQRARQQAAREKEERIEALRAKGIIPLTAEEREKVQAEGEDLMEMARREGEDLRRKEKAAAKKERKEKGEEDPFRDSSDDEDWEDGKDDLELSGSGSDDQEEGASDASGEEEDNEDDDEEEDELALDGQEQERTAIPNVMFDNEADETDDDEAEAQLSTEEQIRDPGDLDDHQEDEDVPINRKSRRVRKSNIISDDEDEGNPVVETPSAPRTVSPTQLHTDSPKAPNSVLRSATKTFIPGLTIAGPAGLGLTQIFAGTMDDSQIEDFDESSAAPNSISQMDAEQDSLAFLRRLPALNLPPFVPTTDEDSAHDVVLDSQPGTFQTPESQSAETQTQGLQLGLSQSQVHGFDSLVDHTATQFSEFPEATQDVGFQHMTPIRGRFVEPPPSTVDTLVAGRSPAIQPMGETPVVKKKGKLRRRAQVATFSDEEEVGEHANAEEEEEAFEISANVFDVMRKASKRKEVSVEEFDKKTSKAKEMVHEQADESEDEYAGLGGASDDESGGEEDGYVKEMIDDEGGKDMDERKLAAFFA